MRGHAVVTGRRGAAVCTLLSGAMLLTACGGDSGTADASASPSGRTTAVASRPNPFSGQALYVDPDGPAIRQVAAWQRESRRVDAARLEKVARQPVATWFAGQRQDPYQSAKDLTTGAAAAGKIPVLVLYNIPDRDCGDFSKGGAVDIDAYLAWVGSVAAGLGAGLDGAGPDGATPDGAGRKPAKALVVLEPDAVAQAIQGCGGKNVAQARFRMLDQAVQILKRSKGVSVYLDAGHADWVKDLDALTRSLRASGIRRADGFALNVANFQSTAASVAYGTKLSDRLGGAHFVIDTSRNGAGPQPAAAGDHKSSWCNPKGARLGTPPTTSSGHDRVDALLWVKQPGNSDGACRPGAPAAGGWWPDYALDLVGS